MAINNPTYLHRRMTESKSAAELAQRPEARKAYLTLAKLYDEQWQATRTEAAVSPVSITFRPRLEPEMAHV